MEMAKSWDINQIQPLFGNPLSRLDCSCISRSDQQNVSNYENLLTKLSIWQSPQHHIGHHCTVAIAIHRVSSSLHRPRGGCILNKGIAQTGAWEWYGVYAFWWQLQPCGQDKGSVKWENEKISKSIWGKCHMMSDSQMFDEAMSGHTTDMDLNMMWNK